ncbi:MAG: C69 family dipeptidase [Bacteroidales bacterium]|nr:C69 family dipeptidase [Bacteroidales bacterium]
MKKLALPLLLSFCLVLFLPIVSVAQEDMGDACTNIIITKGASQTGSVDICYTCDAPFASRLQRIPAADHEPGSIVDGFPIRGNVEVKQIAHTYAVLASNGIGHNNEYQLSIGETTFGGRRGLGNKEGLHYSDLMTMALQRCKTAREAIYEIANLGATYGYKESGESISIGDTEEAWLMEIIGKGDEKGIVWVAVRIPDGTVCAHANQSRITEFPMDDPENCLYADDVITFAKKKDFYNKKDGHFNFSDVYDPASTRKKRGCAMRVWSILQRSAPSVELSTDYFLDVADAARYPLSVTPDEKLNVNDVFSLLRDHYDDTEFDMTKGDKTGAFGSPNQTRSERAVSVNFTAFSIVSQSRSFLPDPIGGVLWYSPDDTYTSCYVPLYCNISKVPEAYTIGENKNFTWNSAWWTINFVANFANLHYDKMIVDIQKEQSAIENHFLALQPAIEKTALELLKSDPEMAQQFLTEYSVQSGELVMKKWRELGESLISRYTR